MKVAFLSEMILKGKVPANYTNLRTEFAWMRALDAEHYPLYNLNEVKEYDHVFIIFPKGNFNSNIIGLKIADTPNPITDLLSSDWLTVLKNNNKKVYFVQEGPSWMFTEMEVLNQANFYNMLTSVDAIFAHNWSDVGYYNGLVPGKPVHVLPTLMIEDFIKDIVAQPEDKTIVGGNFARWYGGFESYIVAQEFNNPVWGQTSHAMKDDEDQLIKHLPRVQWLEWMKQLSTFKYAVHLMPTVAAGTFALNCAYLGIPCIGNKKVDTQSMCHPSLSVDIDDIRTARYLAKRLREDERFYLECKSEAIKNYGHYYQLDCWKDRVLPILYETN